MSLETTSCPCKNSINPQKIVQQGLQAIILALQDQETKLLGVPEKCELIVEIPAPVIDVFTVKNITCDIFSEKGTRPAHGTGKYVLINPVKISISFGRQFRPKSASFENIVFTLGNVGAKPINSENSGILSGVASVGKGTLYRKNEKLRTCEFVIDEKIIFEQHLECTLPMGIPFFCDDIPFSFGKDVEIILI